MSATPTAGPGGGTPSALRRSARGGDPIMSRWVTVYGFRLEHAADVLTMFEHFGDIVDHEVGTGNYVHLKFANVESARYALAQHGLHVQIGPGNQTSLMIGVKMRSGNVEGTAVRAGGTSASVRRRRQRQKTPTGGRTGAGKTPRSSARAKQRMQRLRGRAPPPEHETNSEFGRSTHFPTSDRRYKVGAWTSSSKSPGLAAGVTRRDEPRKDLSCCQLFLRYLWPSSW